MHLNFAEDDIIIPWPMKVSNTLEISSDFLLKLFPWLCKNPHPNHDLKERNKGVVQELEEEEEGFKEEAEEWAEEEEDLKNNSPKNSKKTLHGLNLEDFLLKLSKKIGLLKKLKMKNLDGDL